MVSVFFNSVIHHDEVDGSLLEHLYSIFISVITSFTDHSLDSGVYYHHGASSARRHLAEERSAFERYAESGGLYDCVLFSVKGAHTMLAHVVVEVRYLANVVSCVIAVWQT